MYFSRIILPVACMVVATAGTTACSQDATAQAGLQLFSHKAVAGMDCSSCHVNSASLPRSALALDFSFSQAHAFVQPMDAVVGAYRLRPVTDRTLRKHLRLGDDPVLLVTAIDEPDTSESQMQVDDLIVAVDGKSLGSLAEAVDTLQSKKERIQVELIRGGARLTKELDSGVFADKTPYRVGVATLEVPASLRSQLQLDESQGLLVTRVVAGSPSEKAGLFKHDIILKSGGKPILSQEDLRAIVDASGGTAIELEIMRHGRAIKLAVVPEPAPPASSPSAYAEWPKP
ncbi:MAG: hypothetical protein Aurels2KO_14020 [Aureliella sp.]